MKDARPSVLPDAEYLLVASRLIPDLDAGFTIAVLRRARDMAAAGARVQVLTLDPGTSEDHAAHREEWRRRGLLPDGVVLRNLFDEARTDAAWLRAAATPLRGALPAGERRAVTDAAGSTVVELPVLPGNPEWHLTTEPVVVWSDAAPVGSVEGFGGLYRTWLNSVIAGVPGRAVVLCEARQVGELLVADAAPLLGPSALVLHETHACHVLPPYHWDSPMDPAWTRWLDVADRFDGVLWLTKSQQRDVERRIDTDLRSSVVPHPVPAVGPNEPQSGRLVMMCSLIARKRVDDAIRALAEVRTTVPQAQLHVYGGGAMRAELEALASELGLADAVVLHGHVSDLDEAWRTADAFVFASTNEGQGLVVAEAFGRGVPVISYDMPYGPADMLSGGGGVLVPNGEVEALAAAMREVVGDRARRAELAAQARAAASVMGPEASMAALADAVRAAIAEPIDRPGR